MSGPSADNKGRLGPLFIILALSALSWALVIAMGMVVWTFVGSLTSSDREVSFYRAHLLK